MSIDVFVNVELAPEQLARFLGKDITAEVDAGDPWGTLVDGPGSLYRAFNARPDLAEVAYSPQISVFRTIDARRETAREVALDDPAEHGRGDEPASTGISNPGTYTVVVGCKILHQAMGARADLARFQHQLAGLIVEQLGAAAYPALTLHLPKFG